jgi:protein tyrosine/serine phosphatase
MPTTAAASCAWNVSTSLCAIDSGVYYAYLRTKNVKVILNVRFLPFLAHAERRKAKEYGIVYLYGLMNASTFAPPEKGVDRILEILHDPCNQPVYFHCDIGRDRTSLIATLYKVYFEDLPPQDAWRQMRDFGFKDSWTLDGLKSYLTKHLTEPVALAASSPQSCSGQ